MKWSEEKEPICVDTNKKRLMTTSLKKMREKYGYGKVDRGSAMISAKIVSDDIEMEQIEVINFI